MEVLATLVLIGVVVPVAMRGVVISMHASAQARRQLEAAQLAQHKIAEMLVLRDASLFVGSGDFGTAWPDYRWQSEASLIRNRVYGVTLTVTWPMRNTTGQYRVSTLVYAQTGTGEADDMEEAEEPAGGGS